MTDWIDDPLERARFLDGEGSASERAGREASLADHPTARARLAPETRWLEVFRRGALDPEALDPAFEARVREALRADRTALVGSGSKGAAAPILSLPRSRARRFVPWAASAAAVLVAAITWTGFGRVAETHAADRDVLLAAETFRSAERGQLPAAGTGTGATCEEGAVSPHRFPLVVSGETHVEACASGADGGTSVSVLRGARGEEGQTATPRGLVTVPWDGKSSSTDVGYTRVGDLVVFDVAIGRAKYYLATRWSAVAGTPSCSACHGPAHADNPSRNPHRFVERPRSERAR